MHINMLMDSLLNKRARAISSHLVELVSGTAHITKLQVDALQDNNRYEEVLYTVIID